MKKFLLLFAIVFIGINTITHAQNGAPKKFKLRNPTGEMYHIKGNFTMLGNTVMQAAAGNNSNASNIKYVNIDNDPNIINSSSANLVFPTQEGAQTLEPKCTKIIFAGLYWAGRYESIKSKLGKWIANPPVADEHIVNGITLNKKKIKFKGPKATEYTEFTATDFFISNVENANEQNVNEGRGYSNMYSCFADVTEYVKTQGEGKYTAANILAKEIGSSLDPSGLGKFGVWSLVVVYENLLMKWRDIAIYDGFSFVSYSIGKTDVNISGFETPHNGAVNMRLGVLAIEGDKGVSGDYLKIQKLNTSDFQSLKHDYNSKTNYFNSSIYLKTNGTDVPRNPVINNNMGIDIAMMQIDNPDNSVIANSQTETTFRLGTDGDTYAATMIAMAVNTYVPELVGQDVALDAGGTVSQTTIKPGQEGTFKIEIYNKGSEDIENAVMYIPIPVTASYIDNSVTVNGGTAEIIEGTEVPAETVTIPELNNEIVNIPAIPVPGGKYIKWTLPANLTNGTPTEILATLTYKIKATEDCFILQNPQCVAHEVTSQGFIRGQGATSHKYILNQTTIDYLGFQSGECPGDYIPKPTSLELKDIDEALKKCKQENKNQTLCQGTETKAIDFKFAGVSSETNSVVYKWTNNKPEIGLAASGTGNIASFTTLEAGVATIKVTPRKFDCDGNPETFKITVSKTPKFKIKAESAKCNNEPSKIIVTITSGTGSYTINVYVDEVLKHTETEFKIPEGVSEKSKDFIIAGANTNGKQYSVKVEVINEDNTECTSECPEKE